MPAGGPNGPLTTTVPEWGGSTTSWTSATWRTDLTRHFEGIFAKAPAGRTSRALGDTRQALAALCKQTPWRPFTELDLTRATCTWKKGKATGPDAVTHELLWTLMQEPRWTTRLLHMMNDFLYKGAIPQQVQAGVTILLPKTLAWGGHTTHQAQFGPPQVVRPVAAAAWGGGQHPGGGPAAMGSEGKAKLPNVRHAKDWGVPTWLVKLDVRKAFDSVWQESMEDMVAASGRAANRRRGTGNGGGHAVGSAGLAGAA